MRLAKRVLPCFFLLVPNEKPRLVAENNGEPSERVSLSINLASDEETGYLFNDDDAGDHLKRTDGS